LDEERKLFYHGDIFIFIFFIFIFFIFFIFIFFREPYSRYSGCPSEIPVGPIEK